MFEWGVYEIKVYNQVLKNGPYYDVKSCRKPDFPRVPCDVILHRDDQTPMESKPLF